MNSLSRRCRGYSLIELLVVLAIVGTLAIVAVTYRMDRITPAVKGTLQELHGALLDARSLARSSGRTITMTPAGTGTTATLTYSTTPVGVFNIAADRSATNYCLIDFDGTANPTADALTSLKTAIGTGLGGVDVFPTAAWTANMFKGAPTTYLAFNTNGTANHGAYAAVVGHRNGSVLLDGPIGIILVSASGNTYRYFRANSTSTWMRL